MNETEHIIYTVLRIIFVKHHSDELPAGCKKWAKNLSTFLYFAASRNDFQLFVETFLMGLKIAPKNIIVAIAGVGSNDELVTWGNTKVPTLRMLYDIL